MKLTKQEDGKYLLDGQGITLVEYSGDRPPLEVEGIPLEDIFVQGFIFKHIESEDKTK